MAQPLATRIAYDSDQSRVTVRGVPDEPGNAARLLRALADKRIAIGAVFGTSAFDGRTDLDFTVGKAQLERARAVVRKVAPAIGATRVDYDERIAHLTIDGEQTVPLASRLLEVLAGEAINVRMLSTSPAAVTCVVRGRDLKGALKALREAFGIERAARAKPAAPRPRPRARTAA